MQQALEKLADSVYPFEVLPEGTWTFVWAGGTPGPRLDGRVMLRLEHSGEQSQVNILNPSINDETALGMAQNLRAGAGVNGLAMPTMNMNAGMGNLTAQRLPDAPNVVSNLRFHRGRSPQRDVDAAEIVSRHVQGYRRPQVVGW